MELRWPIVVNRRALRRSGGAGSSDAARDQYGVVFRPCSFDVDPDATAQRRADIVRRRGTPGA